MREKHSTMTDKSRTLEISFIILPVLNRLKFRKLAVDSGFLYSRRQANKSTEGGGRREEGSSLFSASRSGPSFCEHEPAVISKAPRKCGLNCLAWLSEKLEVIYNPLFEWAALMFEISSY